MSLTPPSTGLNRPPFSGTCHDAGLVLASLSPAHRRAGPVHPAWGRPGAGGPRRPSMSSPQSPSPSSSPAPQDVFLTLLPRVKLHARIRFRFIRCEDRKEEAIAEAVALVWQWCLRLLER